MTVEVVTVSQLPIFTMRHVGPVNAAQADAWAASYGMDRVYLVYSGTDKTGEQLFTAFIQFVPANMETPDDEA